MRRHYRRLFRRRHRRERPSESKELDSQTSKTTETTSSRDYLDSNRDRKRRRRYSLSSYPTKWYQLLFRHLLWKRIYSMHRERILSLEEQLREQSLHHAYICRDYQNTIQKLETSLTHYKDMHRHQSHVILALQESDTSSMEEDSGVLPTVVELPSSTPSPVGSDLETSIQSERDII